MPASVDSSADQLFELGLFRFKLSSSDPEELHLLQQAFQPILQAPSVSYDQIINTDDCRGLIPPVHPIEAVIARAFRFHDGSLYVEGCVFVTPQNKRILLMGLSQAGKTTLTTAAAIVLKWKIVTEDIVFVDSRTHEVIPFVRPLSLRPGASQLILEAGATLPPLKENRWLIDHELFSNQPVTAKFDYCVLLERDETNLTDFSNVPNTKLLRMILPMSNALHIDDGPNLLNQCLGQSQCFIMRNGNVKDRLNFLSQIADSNELTVSHLVPDF